MNENSSNSNDLDSSTPSPEEVAAEEKVVPLEPELSAEEKLKEDLNKAQNDYLYLKAEFDNYKRNAIKERSDLIKFGAKNLVNDLLEVIDNFDRALDTEIKDNNWQDFKKGIEITAKELKSSLQKYGVEEIPCQGEAFDPTQHEALSSEETDQTPAGHIHHVLKKPYKMHDKVIRAAQVVVAKEKS